MAKIISTGAYLPKNIVRNDFFNKPNNPEELASIEKYMTGMNERRHATPEETGCFMAYMAGKQCLERSGYDPKDIDLVIGNITPNENLMPEDLNIVTGQLECKSAVAIPLNTACSSFVTSLNIANSLLETGAKKMALIINSTNWVNTIIDKSRDYSMFGDGAGAVLLGKEGKSFLLAEEMSDPAVFHTMRMKSPVFSHSDEYFLIREDPKIDMIKEQVTKPIDVAKKLLQKTRHEPDWFIGHQAGVGMLEYWLKQIGLNKKMLKHTFDKYANMMSANIPVTLDHWMQQGAFDRGDKILFFSPAAGAHYMSILWKF
jgi:3-oxoacyl-(acyl-carrier-protein) synthase III